MIEKAFKNEGGYSYVLGQKKVRFLRLFLELQNDPRKLLDEVRALPG